MADPIADKIQENALSPKRVRGDSGEVENPSLVDQIEADRYLQSKNAMTKKGLGIRFAKLIPPGAD